MRLGLIPLLMVVLSRMEAVLLELFAIAKSGFPSPLKSPMLTDRLVPVRKVNLGAKVGMVARCRGVAQCGDVVAD